jgi:hypothetical protein
MNWEKILSDDVFEHMKHITKESDTTINSFFDVLKARNNDLHTIHIAKEWNTFYTTQQSKLAVKYAGLRHVSRFFIFMNYFSKKVKKEDFNV